MKVVRNLIEYYIDECSYIKAPNFKEANVDFTFPIECNKPKIDKILSVNVTPKICYKKLLKTPSGKSLEGQNLNGSGLLLEGDLKINIEYISNTNNLVYTVQAISPFCIYIVLPKSFKFNSLVTASILIEDIDARLLSERIIYGNVTLMAIADIC